MLCKCCQRGASPLPRQRLRGCSPSSCCARQPQSPPEKSKSCIWKVAAPAIWRLKVFIFFQGLCEIGRMIYSGRFWPPLSLFSPPFSLCVSGELGALRCGFKLSDESFAVSVPVTDTLEEGRGVQRWQIYAKVSTLDTLNSRVSDMNLIWWG